MALVVVDGAAATGASLAGNAATGDSRWPGVLDVLREHAWLSFGVLTVVVVVAAITATLMEGERSSNDRQSPPSPNPQDWFIDRAETDRVVAAVCDEKRLPGITATIGLHGAGGFGKTILADLVCADRRVRRRFRDEVYQIALGRDVHSSSAIAAKVGEATKFITRDTDSYDDPLTAGSHLGRLLDQRPTTLLIIDDVWSDKQLKPFLRGGDHCMRLVTTRTPHVLPSGAMKILVDKMSADQARALLTYQLPSLPEGTTDALLRATGRWPLLLRLTNKFIARQIDTGADPTTAADQIVARLRHSGPTALDPDAAIDPNDSEQRNASVRAAIEASTELLPSGNSGSVRFTELAVFVEDEPVPIELVAHLWHATGSLTVEESRSLCWNLNELSLLQVDPNAGGSVRLHDVVRDYLRQQLGQQRLRDLHATLVDTTAATLASASPQSGDSDGPDRAWWQMPDGYLCNHLVTHMLDAGRAAQAEALVLDLRWITWRLGIRDHQALWSDLTAIDSDSARLAANDLDLSIHLLSPIEPSHALDAIVRSRLGHHDRWRDQAASWRPEHPTLRSRWPLHDLPHPNQRRTLADTHLGVTTIGVSPDSTWLTTGNEDGSVCVWDTTTRTTNAVLTGHANAVTAIAVSRDATRLTTASRDGIVRVWDANTQTTTTAVIIEAPTCLAISPDGTWLATCEFHGTIRIRRMASRDPVTAMRTEGQLTSCAWLPDSSGIAVGGAWGPYLYAFVPGPGTSA